MDDKKFRISRNKLMVSGLVLGGVFLATAIIGVKLVSDDNDALRCVLISLAVAIVAAIVSAILVKEDYIRILDDGFELIKGKKVVKHPYTDFAGSNVTRHYMNGIYYGTTREISIKGPDGKAKKINANNLSKSAFAELVTYLGKSSYMQTHDIEVSADYFNEKREFIIPNEKIIKAVKNKMILWCVGSIALLLAFIGLAGYYFSSGDDNAVIMTLMIFAGLGSVIMFLFEGLWSIVLYKKIKNLPDRVCIDQYTLNIGDLAVGANNILNISMVPASYNILTRDMIVIMKDNTKYKYNFGKHEIGDKQTYDGYKDLFRTVELWCIVNGINFMNILG